MPPPLPRVVRFAVFELDTRAGELRRDGLKVRLQDRPLQLLLLLLARGGDVVTRDELRDALWPADTFVDFDHSLATAVAKLRSALGDSARTPRFVETVGGRGYRFLVPVQPTESDPPDRLNAPEPAAPQPRRSVRWGTAVLAGFAIAATMVALTLGLDLGGARTWLRRQTNPGVKTIAVLPFRNLSGDAAQDYLVDGMTEQLITTLAGLPGLQVTSRTSAMQFKERGSSLPVIGRALGVDAIVEGSVRRDGARVRITAQLTAAATDRHLWASSYDRSLDDVLVVESDIARDIADEIRLHLSDAHAIVRAAGSPLPVAVQETYLLARYHLNQGDEPTIRQSVDEFQRVIAQAPDDARAYAGLATAYVMLSDYYDRPSTVMPDARKMAERALRLDPASSQAHAALGAVRFLYDWDWAEAESEFRKATTAGAGSSDAFTWLGAFLAQMGRGPEAIAAMRQAEALDPLSVPVHLSFGWVYFLGRQNDRAIAEWRKALAIEPHLAAAHISMWMASIRGDSATAAVSPPADVAAMGPIDLAMTAGTFAALGQRDRADAVLSRLKDLGGHRYVCPYELATAQAALGRKDVAIHWLEQGVADRSTCMPDLKMDPRLDSLRDDPRFAALMRQVGFK